MGKNIYHYCSFNTFYTIINNKTIRLSDVTQSNDYDEIKWSEHLIKDIFYRKVDEIFSDQNDVEKAKQYINTNLEYFFDSSTHTVLACCFSESKDLLSQWRGYAEDGKGFSIGFNVKKMNKLLNTLINKECKIVLDKVVYNEDKQLEIIEKEINSFLTTNNINKISDFENIKKLFEILFEKVIYFKNPFFSEEVEWRICVFFLSNNYRNVSINDFRLSFYNNNNNNKILPYLDIKYEGKENIISEIIMGPKNFTEKLVEFLGLKSINCNIYKSKGTYR